MKKPKRTKKSRGGGWPAVRYPLKMAFKSRKPIKFFRALRQSNVCKACAFGMKGMRNELGEGFQVCKKAMQAIAQDLKSPIPEKFWAAHSIGLLKTYSGRELEGLGRIANPLYRKGDDNFFSAISWEQAYEIAIQRLKDTNPDESFFYASGRSSNEAAFLIQLFARQYGTNNVNNCSFYCHQASGVGLSQTFGSGTATVNLEDVDKSDLVILIGCNPASNHPRFITHLANLRERGGNVLVVNPFRELGLEKFGVPSKMKSLFFTTSVASDYFQPHCGGDMAFIKAITAYLWKKGKSDSNSYEQFMKQNCNNFEDWKTDIESSDIDGLLLMAGISIEQMETFAEYLENADNIIFSWAMGLTHQLHGVDTIRTLANLALMLGMVGKEGSGMLPLRGHSNVQGVGTVGVVPNLKPAIIDNIAKHLKIQIPESIGLDTFASMESAEKGDIKLAILLGGNLFGSNPDGDWASKSLNNIDTTIQISTTLNKGHLFGQGKESLILPVRTRDEENHITTQESMFNYVRYSEGGSKPLVKGMPTESEIFSHLGSHLFEPEPIPWEKLHNHDRIREYIAKVIPGLDKITDIRNNEFTISNRIYHSPSFNTSNGKANLAAFDVPDTRPEKGYYNLTTFRSEGQFNTIIYEDEDLYRGVKHRNVIFMSEEDMIATKIEDGDMVEVESEVGKLNLEVVKSNIRSGNTAIYFPEGNKIVPRKIDPKSKTPSFKRVVVKIVKL